MEPTLDERTVEAALLSWTATQRRLKKRSLAFLPFGVLEQHGPHLPLETDTLMAAALAKELAHALDGLALPALPYGEAWACAGYPGTVSLSFSTAKQLVVEIGQSIYAGGFSGLVVVNGHYGNRAPTEVALRELLVDHRIPATLIDFPGLEEVAASVCESVPAAPGFYHADEFETSLILYLAPELVDMSQAVAEYPDFPDDYRDRPFPLDEISKSGVVGDPTKATAAKGKAIFEMLVENSVERLKSFVTRDGDTNDQ